jgi:hypothetical protein
MKTVGVQNPGGDYNQLADLLLQIETSSTAPSGLGDFPGAADA